MSCFQVTHYSDFFKCVERINCILLLCNDEQVEVWFDNYNMKIQNKKTYTWELLVVRSSKIFIDILLIITSCPRCAFLRRVAQELGILFATSGSVSFRCKTRKFLDELSYCARNRRSVSKGRRKHNRRKMPFSVLV